MAKAAAMVVFITSSLALINASPAAAATIDVRGDGTGNAIGKAVNAAQPGDTVIVHAGTYGRQSITKLASAVVVVRPAASERVTVRGFDIKASTNITVRDFKASGSVLGSNHIHSSSQISIVNNRIDVPSGPGVACHVNVSTRLYHSGIGICVKSHHVTIDGNVISRGFRNIALYGGTSFLATNLVHHIDIRNNDLSAALQDDLIQMSGTDAVTIEGNYFHDLNDTFRSDGSILHNDGVEVLASSNVRLLRNEMTWPGGDPSPPATDADQGIIVGPGPGGRPPGGGTGPDGSFSKNILIANNLIHHWNGPAVNIAAEDVDIVNNTLLPLSRWQGIYLDTRSKGVRIWNNIINKLQRENSTVPVPVYEQNNVILRQPGNPLMGADTSPARNLIYDPLFASQFVTTSASSLDRYVLKPTSSAVNSGDSASGTPTVDWANKPRNVGIVDRGAREYRP